MIDESKFKRLKARLVIDTVKLDDELVHLPALQQEAAELAAEAQRVRDKVHDLAKQVEAEIRDLKRKADPKLSEARLSSEVLLDDQLRDALTAVAQADYELALWRSIADGMRTKSASIRTIAELIAAGYASPDSIRNERLHEAYGPKRGRN